jgi:hypothetical protein
MEEKKRGRPQGERYPIRIPVGVNAEMKASLEKIAKENGISVSHFIRNRLKKIIEAYQGYEKSCQVEKK